MNVLLAGILDAHGSRDRWNRYQKIEATIVSGGGFFLLKGVLQDSSPRRMTVWLHEQRSSVLPYGAPISARCSPRADCRRVARWPSATRPRTRLPASR